MKCHYDIFQVIFLANLREVVRGLVAWDGLLGDLQIYLNPPEVYGLEQWAQHGAVETLFLVLLLF